MGKSDLHISSEDLGELIGSVYEAALDPQHFDTRADEISRRVHAFSPMILVRSRREVAGYPVSEGLRPPALSPRVWQDFLTHYSRIDPMGPALTAQAPGLYNYAGLPNSEAYFASEFYNDFSKPARCAHSAVSWRPHGLDQMLITCFHREDEFGTFREDEIRFLATLEPHISRAAQLGLRLRAAGDQLSMAEQALHRMEEGVLFVQANGAVGFANQSGERILDDADGLGSLRGKLIGHDARSHKELRAAIAAASGQTSHHETARELAVTRPSGCHPYRVLVAPISGQRQRPVGAAGCTAMIFIGHADRDFDSAQTWLRIAYDLTPTEARLASSLVSGLGLTESADALAIGIGTARSHLKSIFGKMRVGKQSELIRIVLLSTGATLESHGKAPE